MPKLTNEKKKLFSEIAVIVGLLNKFQIDDIKDFCQYYNNHNLQELMYLREQYSGDKPFVSYYDRNRQRILEQKKAKYQPRKKVQAQAGNDPTTSDTSNQS